MSAEVLRAAARLMRVRAEAATEGPLDVSHWREGGKTTHHTLCKHETRTVRGQERGGFIVRQVAMSYADRQGHADLLHIATWHPAVALAVADWLETWANTGWQNGTGIWDRRALAVARTCLGESAWAGCPDCDSRLAHVGHSCDKCGRPRTGGGE